MTNEIPFDEWLNEQGDNVRLAMCDGHPETLILVDMNTMSVYKYVPAENQDDAREKIHEFLSKLGPSNITREVVQHDNPLDFKVTKASDLKAEDVWLQERILHELLITRDIVGLDKQLLRTRLADYGAIGDLGGLDE